MGQSGAIWETGDTYVLFLDLRLNESVVSVIENGNQGRTDLLFRREIVDDIEEQASCLLSCWRQSCSRRRCGANQVNKGEKSEIKPASHVQVSIDGQHTGWSSKIQNQAKSLSKVFTRSRAADKRALRHLVIAVSLP